MADLVNKLPIAITCGDPAGVGPEIIESILEADPELAAELVVIGPGKWLAGLRRFEALRTLAVGAEDFKMSPGQPSLEGASLALAAMRAAAQGCREGSFRGVVTGPVSKYWLKQTGYEYIGQTEFFADEWGGSPTMAFIGDRLRVVLATWHIALRDVPEALDAACLEKAVMRACQLGQLLGVTDPRIGVCGLNPHAGEEGLLGQEEIEVMNPLLDRLRGKIPGVSRCLPGDTVFNRQLKGEFDVVIAAYHDQGLAAVKTLEFDSAVNVTLGLPYLRTSPDHGTAYEIAGQGNANSGSFASAIRVLLDLTA